MKLEYILDNLGSLEKNSFIKVIDSVINRNPKNIKAIDKILINSDKGAYFADTMPRVSEQTVPLSMELI